MIQRKKKTNYYKVFVYIILIMTAIGFTIPGFLDFGEEQQNSAPPRVCQSDSDCYLMCNEEPIAVLCYQNLCQQNSCQEEPLYPYQAVQNTVQLNLNILGNKTNLKQQSEKLGLQNFFVLFQEDSFTSLAPKMTLSHVLDKLRIKFGTQCLTFNNENYCQDNEYELKMFVNDNQSYAYGDYEVQDNDQLRIIYNKKP